MGVVDDANDFDVLDKELQGVSDELKDLLEDVEFGMIEIDDLIAETKSFQTTKLLLDEIRHKFSQLDNWETISDAQEKRASFHQSLQQIRSELIRNEIIRGDISEKLSSEKGSLETLVEKIGSIQKVNTKRVDLIHRVTSQSSASSGNWIQTIF